MTLIIGILLVTICTALIIYDRKKFVALIRLVDEKEHQLSDIISDAELMIEELNNLSDYVINEIEQKNTEFKENIQSYQKEINDISEKTEELLELINKVSSNHEMKENEIIRMTEVTSETDSMDEIVSLNNKYIEAINSKYKEVIRLYNEGLEETEIARRLNMGKGEIHLVLQFITAK